MTPLARAALCTFLLIALLCSAASALGDNNTTANETTNQSSGFKIPDLPDPRGIVASTQNYVADTLVDGGQDPYDTMFLFAGVLIIICIYFMATSGAAVRLQGGTKYILYILAFIVILWYLEVI